MALIAPGLLGLPQTAPREDERQRSMINDAVIQGQQAETDRQNAQQYAQLAASLPLYDPTNLDYARQLVAAKVGYEQAADAAEQARHHENAEIVRREAAKNGIDLSRFDAAKVNANQANTNLSMMINEARRDFMNQETPDELYTRRKNELMRGGLNEERAMDQAAREYQEYSARYRHAGRNLFYDQGTTENAINNLGAYVLTGLGDPQTAQMFASMYAHPVDDYKKNWATEKAYMAADIANKRDAQRHAWSIEDFDRRLRGERENAAFRHGLDMDTLQQRSSLDSAAFVNRMGQVYNLAIDAGYSPEDALSLAISSVGGGRSGGSSGKNANNNQNRTEIMKEVRSRMKDIEDKYSGDTDALKNDAEYQQLTQTYSDLLYGGGSSGSGNGNQEMTAEDAMTYAGKIIRENASKGYPKTKAELKELLRPVIGDYVDWIEWGDEQDAAPSQVSNSQQERQPVKAELTESQKKAADEAQKRITYATNRKNYGLYMVEEARRKFGINP